MPCYVAITRKWRQFITFIHTSQGNRLILIVAPALAVAAFQRAYFPASVCPPFRVEILQEPPRKDGLDSEGSNNKMRTLDAAF